MARRGLRTSFCRSLCRPSKNPPLSTWLPQVAASNTSNNSQIPARTCPNPSGIVRIGAMHQKRQAAAPGPGAPFLSPGQHETRRPGDCTRSAKKRWKHIQGTFGEIVTLHTPEIDRLSPVVSYGLSERFVREPNHQGPRELHRGVKVLGTEVWSHPIFRKQSGRQIGGNDDEYARRIRHLLRAQLRYYRAPRASASSCAAFLSLAAAFAGSFLAASSSRSAATSAW